MLTDKQKIKVLRERIAFLEKDLEGYREEKKEYLGSMFIRFLEDNLIKQIDEYTRQSQNYLRFYVQTEVNSLRTAVLESYEIIKQLSKKMELLEGLSHGSDRPKPTDIGSDQDQCTKSL